MGVRSPLIVQDDEAQALARTLSRKAYRVEKLVR